eukprot:GHVP01018114.1.p1 GENE.GHVP01018114.1~~GHVP01018114.1.p1  ORF type:complete len:299 (+),score=46.55 GHVP01018114.1:1772-2668(+)
MAAELSKHTSGILDAGYFHRTPFILEISSKPKPHSFGWQATSIDGSPRISATSLWLRSSLLRNISVGVQGTPFTKINGDIKWEATKLITLGARSCIQPKNFPIFCAPIITSSFRPKTFSSFLEYDFFGKKIKGDVYTRNFLGDTEISTACTISSLLGESLKSQDLTKAQVAISFASLSKVFPLRITGTLSCAPKRNFAEEVKMELFYPVDIVNAKLSFASRLTRNFQNGKNFGVIGGSVMTKKDSTVFKWKLDSCSKLAVSIQKKLTDEISFSCGTEFDVKDGKASESFGLKVGICVV